MENKEAMEKKKKAAQKLTMRVLLAMTLIVIGYVVYGLITKDINMILFEILLMLFVTVYLVFSDVVEPWKTGLLQDLTPDRKSAYLKILAADVIGAGALFYWISGMSSEAGNDFLIPVLIYFVATQMKRKIRPEFENGKEETGTEEETEADPEDDNGEQ